MVSQICNQWKVKGKSPFYSTFQSAFPSNFPSKILETKELEHLPVDTCQPAAATRTQVVQ